MTELKYTVPLMQKSGRAVPMVASQYDGQVAWTEWDLETVARQGYKKNTVCYGAISDLSSSAASVPFVLKDGRGQIIKQHPLLTLLNKPNPLQGKHEFWEAVYAFRWMSGNAYIEGSDGTRTPDPETITELYCLPPQHMKVVLGRIGIQLYRFTYNGIDLDYPVNVVTGRSSVMHWKSFNPTNLWYGMSPLEAAGIALDIFNDSNVWNRSLLKNGGRPSGAITFKDDEGGMLTDEQFDRLEAQVQNKYAGANAAGKILLLEGGLYWQQMSMSPHDMDFLNSRNTTARDVAAALQYPAMLLNIPGDNTYSNQKEARLALWEDTIIPSMVTPLCSHLTRWLAPYYGDDLVVTYDEDAITALQPRRDATWKRAQRSEWVTVNEKRVMTGFPPVEGGDVVLLPVGAVPVKLLSSQTILPSAVGTPGPAPSKALPFVTSKENDRIQLLMKSLSPMSIKESDNGQEMEEQLKVQDSIVKTYEPRILSLLNDTLSKGVELYKRGAGASSIYNTFNEALPEAEKALSALYAATMFVAGQRIFNGLKAVSSELEMKRAESTFEAAAQLWIMEHALEAATSIFETSKNQVRDYIVAGIAEGLSTEEIGTGIFKELAGDVSKARAKVISRTEVHRSFTVAGHEAVKASGVPVKKRWLAADDERTRDTHAAAEEFNGDLEIDDYFQVGNSKLLYPGDSNGEAKEIINCRCGVRHIPIYQEGAQ